MADYTLTYDEGVKGWTSFHSFIPEGMVKLRNKLYTFKDGQLYEHNVSTADRNTFYGTFAPSKVELIVNQSPSENKVLKAVALEATSPWTTTIKAFESDQEEYKQTSIDDALYQEREGMWYTFLRRAEAGTVTDSDKSYYGLGEVATKSGGDVTIDGGVTSSSIGVGDLIYKTGDILIGEVTARITNGITISDSVVGDLTLLSVGDFIYGKKDARIEGTPLRGYVFDITLENDNTTRQELFAFNGEVFKSYK